MKILGITSIILGLLAMVLGGLALTCFSVYDMVVNWEVLTRSDIFWDIVLILVRDVIAVIVGGILYAIGVVLIKID